MREVAIAGPGLMGLGIAQVCARAGWQVRLLGRDAAAAHAGLQRLAQALQRQVDRGRLTPAQSSDLLARVRPVQHDEEIAGCLGAIESVPEDRTLKEAVLQRLQAALPATAWIATNTSGLPITALGATLAVPGRFIGLHFFSPVDRMKLVEVVAGAATTAATRAAALDFVRDLGQQPVVVRDGPGFYTSRVFAAYLDEAMALVGEGVSIERIDAVGLRLGRAVGPLALLDDIGLALNLQQARQALADGLPAAHCRPLAEPVLAALVAAGRSGRRQGGGFYEAPDAPGGTGRRPWPGLQQLFPAAATPPNDDTLALRLRLAEALEALRCLEEGVIASADEADTASVLGLGFPAAQGGILRWCEDHGLARLVDDAANLATQAGLDRFTPSPWLRDLSRQRAGLSAWRYPSHERNSP